MFLIEVEAKRLLAERGIKIPWGRTASTPEEAAEITRELGRPVAVKAQVPAGKRGKSGGISFAGSVEEARKVAQEILGADFGGFTAEKVLVEEKIAIQDEFYAAVFNDHSRYCPLILFSISGGMEVEEIYATSPEKMLMRTVDIRQDFSAKDALEFLKDAPMKQLLKEKLALLLVNMYNLYQDLDAELVEINPLTVAGDQPMAMDCKLIIDDSALKRHPELETSQPLRTELEQRAHAAGLKYIQLNGNVGILANGAGLTMATMDTVAYFGGKPANFLEIGGDAYKLAMPALAIALSHPGIKSLFVNLCGAFARTDVMADGITRGLQELKPSLPVVFSIHGTGETEARELVKSRLGIEPYEEMDEAARAAVRLANQ